MSKKPFEPKYKTFTNNKTMVKVGCSYAGKMHYGYAYCSPEDEFDFDKGYRLAKARVDFDIYCSKLRRSQDKLDYYRHMAEMFHTWVKDEEEYEQMLYKQFLGGLDELNAALELVEAN